MDTHKTEKTNASYIDGAFWASDIAGIFSHFKTSNEGLSEDKVQLYQEKYGKNVFRNKEKKTAFSIFMKQLMSPLIFILCGAGVVTFFLQEWVECIVIASAVLVNTGLGFYREYHAENTIEKLGTFIKDRSRVVRGGIEQEIDSEMLVPGDIIKLAYGNRIPADIRIIHSGNLSVDESILTGESVAVKKTAESQGIECAVAERTSMAHAGTLVVDGYGLGVIVATGDMTEIGKIAQLVSGTTRSKTPIQKGLERLSWIIFAVVLVIVIGIFILGISRGEPFFEMLVLSVAVSVGAVPEALPIALTVILSIGAERIAKKKGIARTLMATETLGSASLIMTDKTGTLTEANMRLEGVYTYDCLLSENLVCASTPESNTLLSTALSGVDVYIENPEDDSSKWIFKGRPFEVNIAKTAQEKGIDISSLGNKDILSVVVPFNSTHKFSVSRYKDSYVTMGAPDILLARAKISKDEYLKIEQWITDASTDGKRLIALGRIPTHGEKISVSDVVDIEFLGILAFRDPIRKEVPQAIQKIQSLGVRVVMITGDLKGTALSVARELGWDVTEKNVLSGQEIASLSDEALLKIIPDIKIFARVTPEDKLRIGTLYQSLGEVVAMTGDGVNDSPALKAMDIGVALGSGSDVAKSAADLVLLDDNFEIIAASIGEGRRILANIQKTFVYLMSNSLDEVLVVGGSLIAGIALPLTALQIIWVNLFTGSLPAIAFAYDADIDHETAKKHSLKSIFTREVNVLTFGIGITSSLLLFVLYYLLIRFGVEVSLARSVFFVCFASYILAISFSFRSLHKPLFSYNPFSNKKLNQSILVACVFLIATMAIPALRGLFDLAPIPAVWLWFVLGWLVLNIMLVEMAKLFFRR